MFYVSVITAFINIGLAAFFIAYHLSPWGSLTVAFFMTGLAFFQAPRLKR